MKLSTDGLSTEIKFDDKAEELWKSAPAEKHSLEMGSQMSYYSSLDTDRISGCIRDISHAYVNDGGLAVLHGNIAKDGCVVKTAGVDESLFHFEGPARVFESQDEAVEAILGDKIKAGDVVVIIHEGPKGGPGMQEMLYPNKLYKVQTSWKSLRTDYRRSFLRRYIRPFNRPYLSRSSCRRRSRPVARR